MALSFRPGIRLRHAQEKATTRFRESGKSRRHLPLAAERIASLLLLPCSSASGVRVDEYASRPLRANVAEALLGGGGQGDGGEVLGHSPLRSGPRIRSDERWSSPILRPIFDGESHRGSALESYKK